MTHFFLNSFPSPLSSYVPKLESRLPITWITIELPLSHSMKQPYLVSGFHSVTSDCKTVASSFALCLGAIIFSFLIGVSTISHFYFLWYSWMSFIWAMWFAVLELHEVLPRIHCSNMSITLVFAHLSAKAVILQSLSESLFSLLNPFVHLSHWQCSIPTCHCSHSILPDSFSMLHSSFFTKSVRMSEVHSSLCCLRTDSLTSVSKLLTHSLLPNPPSTLQRQTTSTNIPPSSQTSCLPYLLFSHIVCKGNHIQGLVVCGFHPTKETNESLSHSKLLLAPI